MAKSHTMYTAGAILWLPAKDDIAPEYSDELEGFERGCFNHPALVLSVSPSKDKAAILIITSLHETDLAERHPSSVRIRAEYIPIHPSNPHPDNGSLLYLSKGSRLPKNSYVKTTPQQTVNPKVLRLSRNPTCRLKKSSLKKVVEFIGFESPWPVSGPAIQPLRALPINAVPVNTIPIITLPINNPPIKNPPTSTLSINTRPVITLPVDTRPVNVPPIDPLPVDTRPVGTRSINTQSINARPVNFLPVDPPRVVRSPISQPTNRPPPQPLRPALPESFAYTSTPLSNPRYLDYSSTQNTRYSSQADRNIAYSDERLLPLWAREDVGAPLPGEDPYRYLKRVLVVSFGAAVAVCLYRFGIFSSVWDALKAAY